MWIVLGLMVLAAVFFRPRSDRHRGPPLFSQTAPHWRRCYSRRNFLRLGGALVGAGVFAYSGADEAVERFHSERIRCSLTDSLARLVEPTGRRFLFINWALLAALDWTWHSSSFTRWGRRNFEAILVGLPTLWSLQYGLGGSRPTDPPGDPRWRPLADDNSASGHAFMAAVPWLNLAHLAGGRPGRWSARFASGLTGWSRLNDRKHYLSQVGLGYGIAWTAVEAVTGREAAEPRSSNSGVT